MTDVYWLEQAEADVPAPDDWLTAAELAVLAPLRIPKRRADWRLGRWTAKCAVATLLPEANLRFTDIGIHAAPSGAPEAFLRGEPAPFTISLTHREGVAVCAVARAAALGCDLELVEPRSRTFVTDYFTPAEQAFIAQSSGADQARLTNLLWSAKESALKALRTGLRLDTREVSVALTYGPGADEWRPLEVRCAPEQVFPGWWRARGRFVLTLVATPPPTTPVALHISGRSTVSAGSG